jgi:hypothetical protein
VDGVLCGVQAHKCPNGGLEPEGLLTTTPCHLSKILPTENKWHGVACQPLPHANFRIFYRGKRRGMVLPANPYPMPTFESLTEGIARTWCFSCPCCCCWQVWARECVWKGVDGVLCGVQAHKCPKGGLEPESVEFPILGTWPANCYPMPAFEHFTEGKDKAWCCLPTPT